MKRLVILGLVWLSAGCGLLGPEVECVDIPRDACLRAIQTATADVEARVGPRSWFEALGPTRIVVAPGCGFMEGGCPASAWSTTLTVSYFSGIEGEEPIHEMVSREEVGLPDASG